MIIVLLTDFGQSEYVGIMKGVIYNIAPNARITDLCHDISPQNVIEASWILKNSYKFFLEGAIFCCVVDPGVGSERKALAVKTDSFYFVAPDNGLLWETVKRQNICRIRQLPVAQDASKTFHGRDVFARAAANITLGQFESLGPQTRISEKLELYLNPPEGLVVRIDRFGNIVTNLAKEDKETYCVEVDAEKHTMSFHDTYSQAADNELFLIEGSCNTLEISLKNGNANNTLNLKSGQKIKIF